jgi:hypothetical protein
MPISPQTSAAIAIAAARRLAAPTPAGQVRVDDPPPSYEMSCEGKLHSPPLSIQTLGNESTRMTTNYYPEWTEEGLPVGGPRLEIDPVNALPPAVLRELEAVISRRPDAPGIPIAPKQMQAPQPSAPPLPQTHSGSEEKHGAAQAAPSAGKNAKRLRDRQQEMLALLKVERSLQAKLQKTEQKLHGVREQAAQLKLATCTPASALRVS